MSTPVTSLHAPHRRPVPIAAVLALCAAAAGAQQPAPKGPSKPPVAQAWIDYMAGRTVLRRSEDAVQLAASKVLIALQRHARTTFKIPRPQSHAHHRRQRLRQSV